jgi:hypothetical protein
MEMSEEWKAALAICGLALLLFVVVYALLKSAERPKHLSE